MVKYNVTLKRAVVNYLIVCVCITVVQAICYSPIWHLFKLRAGINEFVLSLIVFVVMLFMGRKLKLREISNFLLKRNVILFIIGVFVCGVLGVQIWNIKKKGFVVTEDYIPIIYFFCMLFVMIYEWQRVKTDAELEKAQMEMNMLYYDAYEELVQSVREKQHDFKNHIMTISGMLYADMNKEEIIANQKAYFEEILGDVKETSLLTMIENPSLSGFMVHKYKEAQRQGIMIEQRCSFTAQKLKIPEYKLVEMMGILYDNAIEAMPNRVDGKKIWIELWKEDKLLWFSVRNCYDGEIFSDDAFDVGYSSKGRGRGIGLIKLRKLLDENGGEVCWEHGQENGYKTIKFVICVPI